MTLTLRAVPCLSDNYAYLIRDEATGQTAVIDVPDADAVQAALDDAGWTLNQILITHHHNDHIGGVEALREATGARVVGAAADAERLPPLDEAVSPGQGIAVGNAPCAVLDVSGHCANHIAFHFPGDDLAFTGDSLMALGCGRIFEGTPEQMWMSLLRLDTMAGSTRVCSGHDYTASNGRFALTIEPENAALKQRIAGFEAMRAAGDPMAVVRLDEERATNPFLRAHLPELKAAVGMADAPDVEVFAEIRRRKDAFKG